MTVSSSTNRVSYAGNGSTTIFPYTYKIFDQDDLTVILRAADGSETVKTLTSDYTVSGVGSAGGGNVTMLVAPASGETLVILREQPLVQELDIVPNDPFPAESLEAALDKLTFMVQQHEETLDRSLKVSRTTTIATSEFTDTPAQRAGKFLGFDGSGNLSVASTTDSSITVSAYIESFLIAADSASAFAALGVTATNTELNILDGVTASTAEINLLDGVTASTAELNILDGVTADATEINYLDGKTLSGLDTEIITGTAGSDGDIVQWNADGDLVSYGAATQLQATWEAGTGTTESLISPAKVKAASLSLLNASGSAPVYACRAWVNFDGTGTVAIRGSGNVSSITDNGTGDYRINFATAMQDTNYAIITSSNGFSATAVGRQSNSKSDQATGPINKATTHCEVLYGVTSNGALADGSDINVAIFR